MTFFRLMLSEWTKIRSTKSFWWISALMIGVCAFLNAMTGWGTASMTNPDSTEPFTFGAVAALGVVSKLGLVFIIIGAVITVTSEYRHNLVSSTFLATPNRLKVLLAKTLDYAIIGAVLTEITAFVSIVAVKLSVGQYSDQITIAGDDEVIRQLWVLPLMAALLVPFCVGVGALIRQTAGATSLLILWFEVLELLLFALPKVGLKIAEWLPFMNFNAYVSGLVFNTHFSSDSSPLWIFMAWSLVFFAAGAFATIKRDA